MNIIIVFIFERQVWGKFPYIVWTSKIHYVECSEGYLDFASDVKYLKFFSIHLFAMIAIGSVPVNLILTIALENLNKEVNLALSCFLMV